MKATLKSYSSFEELGRAWGLRPVVKQTKDKKKLSSQREAFGKRHLCPACKEPMTYVGGSNIMCCQQPDCNGVKREFRNDETGDVIVKYEPAFHTLDTLGAEIATNIFTEIN